MIASVVGIGGAACTVLSPAVGAVFMSLSTVICDVNAHLLKLNR